jgi:gamma-glutamyltranspeptidase/glutathione hydrolase
MGIVLNVLDGYDWGRLSGAERKHVTVEAMRRAYRDRAAYLGDPEFVPLPLQLLSPGYANRLRAGIRPRKATSSSSLQFRPGGRISEGGNTTHLSIIDAEGNRVSATLSINLPLGSGFMPPGTGVLLNNEMDDFAIRPQTPNAYGLIGGAANKVEPGKRMLSSMSPTFIEAPERIAILGTPGGSRIISMVQGGIMAFAEGAGAPAIVSQPRLHHQYLPDEVVYEDGALSDAEQEALIQWGHRIRRSEPYGNMQAIVWEHGKNNRVEAASDPRGIGQARVQPVTRTDRTPKP